MSLPARRACAFLLALLVMPAAAQRRPDADEAAHQVVARANGLRAHHGLAPLRPQPQLQAAASDFAAFMARTDRYAHEADGRHPADRAEAAGYAYCTVAENIAWQFHSQGFAAPDLADRLVSGWERSPPHRANMLDPAVTDTAVALARSARTGRWYAVQLFGRPASARIEFSIGNDSPRAVRYALDGKPYRLAPRETRRHGQCRATQLVVELDSGAERLAPRGGERWSVRGDGRGLRREAP